MVLTRYIKNLIQSQLKLIISGYHDEISVVCTLNNKEGELLKNGDSSGYTRYELLTHISGTWCQELLNYTRSLANKHSYTLIYPRDIVSNWYPGYKHTIYVYVKRRVFEL